MDGSREKTRNGHYSFTCCTSLRVGGGGGGGGGGGPHPTLSIFRVCWWTGVLGASLAAILWFIGGFLFDMFGAFFHWLSG